MDGFWSMLDHSIPCIQLPPTNRTQLKTTELNSGNVNSQSNFPVTRQFYHRQETHIMHRNQDHIIIVFPLTWTWTDSCNMKGRTISDIFSCRSYDQTLIRTITLWLQTPI